MKTNKDLEKLKIQLEFVKDHIEELMHDEIETMVSIYKLLKWEWANVDEITEDAVVYSLQRDIQELINEIDTIYKATEDYDEYPIESGGLKVTIFLDKEDNNWNIKIEMIPVSFQLEDKIK